MIVIMRNNHIKELQVWNSDFFMMEQVLIYVT